MSTHGLMASATSGWYPGAQASTHSYDPSVFAQRLSSSHKLKSSNCPFRHSSRSAKMLWLPQLKKDKAQILP
jgi:hypothetical protein